MEIIRTKSSQVDCFKVQAMIPSLVVLVSYKRDDQLVYTLQMLNNTRFLDRILVVWNDIERPVPRNLIPDINIPIFVLNATKNSLNNRSEPRDVM